MPANEKVKSVRATAASGFGRITSRKAVITDHRIGLTLHRLETVLNGDMAEIVSALTMAAQSDADRGDVMTTANRV